MTEQDHIAAIGATAAAVIRLHAESARHLAAGDTDGALALKSQFTAANRAALAAQRAYERWLVAGIAGEEGAE